MMKKTLLLLMLLFLGRELNIRACADYNPDWEYYNLFLQEIIDDPQYYPFLLTYDTGYYHAQENTSLVKNENIEQWEKYLGIHYEDACYLVFNASLEDLSKLVKKEPVADEKLGFITPAFMSKYKDALSYLEYAKMLEPYMSITQTSSSWYYYKRDKTAADLDYEEITTELQKRWKKSKDKELKLRYGYQLVRFAHYSLHYEAAIDFFHHTVEALDYRPAMYYHALSQKAGAERGLGNIHTANYDFLKVFVHSRNLKETAFNSIKISGNTDWNALLLQAKNKNEINDAYLFLGYNAFSNPLHEIEKIVTNSPDAIQAKVLMARTVNSIERKVLPLYYPSGSTTGQKIKDKRYPVIEASYYPFFEKATGLVTEMIHNPEVNDKNFWFLTGAYLYFLNKEFTEAGKYLSQVEEKNEKYSIQKKRLAMYLDISKRDIITPELEADFYLTYQEIFERKDTAYYYNLSNYDYNTKYFILDVLANRYFLQGDYAKAFLLNHPLSEIEENPNPELLKELERFYMKPDKNVFEQYLSVNSLPDRKNPEDIQSYFNYIWGILYLSEGNIKQADTAFEKLSPEDRKKIIPDYIFGVNIAECFNCPEDQMMETAYLEKFPFIKERMDFSELTKALIRLEETGTRKNKQASEANYLLGNFFYNISRMGYYRHLVRFQEENYNSYKYYIWEKPDIYKDIYFKYFQTYYPNQTSLAGKYLKKALLQSKDRELKARITFSLSKWEQEKFNDKNNIRIVYRYEGDNILITDRQYFKELMKYRDTEYFEKVESYCKYFNYYTTYCL